MPVDWDRFDRELGPAIEASADRTDEKLASLISSITRLTNEEVIELFPDPADARKLVELMKIVNSAQDRNARVNNIVDNAEKFGGILLRLLERLA